MQQVQNYAIFVYYISCDMPVQEKQHKIELVCNAIYYLVILL